MPPLDSFNISCVLLYISLTNPSPQLMISFSHPSTMLFATVIAMSRKLVPHANVRLPPADDVSPIQLNVQQQQQLQPLPFLNWSLQVLELADGFCRVVVITAIPSSRRFHQTTPYPTTNSPSLGADSQGHQSPFKTLIPPNLHHHHHPLTRPLVSHSSRSTACPG